YSLADLVILPYRSATQSAVLNVSYSFLKPVIATRVGGLKEFVEDNKTGFLVDKESSKALAEVIIKLFELRDTIDFQSNLKTKLKVMFVYKFGDIFEEIIQRLN